MKNLTTTFINVEYEHLGKDVFLVPYYLGKIYGCSVTIVFPETETNKSLPDEYMGVKLVRVKAKKSGSHVIRELYLYKYLFRHARGIDYLMRFHSRKPTCFAVLLYKLLNRKGWAYVKCDLGHSAIPTYKSKEDGTKNAVASFISRRYMNSVDAASCELELVYDNICQRQEGFFAFGDKLRLIPNGFDEDLLKKLGLKDKTFPEKENVIITVGRLGSYEKNTGMILDALAKVDLKDWKVLMIGPVEQNFRQKVDDFYLNNPEKRNQVVFKGPITDKKELWSIYNDAKVFLLTSRAEGSAMVQAEAFRFRNYMVSTDVGAYRDLFGNRSFGETVGQDNPDELAAALHKIVDGTTDVDVYGDYDVAGNSWECVLRRANPLSN